MTDIWNIEKWYLRVLLVCGIVATFSFKIDKAGCGRDGPNLKWHQSPPGYQPTAGFISAGYDAELQNACAIWNLHLPGAMRTLGVFGTYTGSDPTNHYDGISVAYVGTIAAPGTKAISWRAYYESSGAIIEADLEVLSNVTPLTPRTVFLHEVGHYLGAGHSVVSGAVMQAAPNNTLDLHIDDIRFAHCNYQGTDCTYSQDCGCCCNNRNGISVEPVIQTYVETFETTIDSSLYQEGSSGEQWVDMAEQARLSVAMLFYVNPTLYYDIVDFLIANESFAGTQQSAAPQTLSRDQINQAASLLYSVAENASPELSDAVFKIVAVLDQSEGKAFKRTIEDVLTGVTVPWSNIIEWLIQNYPNPFNPTTTIRFRVVTPSQVTIKVFDVLGREVATLANGYYRSGIHQVQFDGSRLSSGIYFYRLVALGRSETSRLLKN